MKMKKILSVAAVLAICASLGVTASAATDPVANNGQTVTISQKYTVTGTKAVNPNDTLSFTVTPVNGAPAGVSAENINVVDGTNEYDLKITLPTYTTVGVYEYTITETNGNKAGVTYDGTTLTLVVTVVNKEGSDDKEVYYAVHNGSSNTADKVDELVNKYEAGTINVTEETIGKFGDKDKPFTATVEFSEPVKDTAKISNGTVTKWSDDGKTATIIVKDGDTVTFDNIPYGTTYEVNQPEDPNYDTTITYADSEAGAVINKVDSPVETAKITNDGGDGDIDTGINLDNLPYALALAGVAVAGGSIVIRRRRVMD